MDYEKKYKEALERARALRNEAIEKEYVDDYIKDYETIFPELRESEDEKTRKRLISICNEWLSGGFDARPCLDNVRWLKNLLEKQKEQKPVMIQWTGKNLKEVIDFTGKSQKFDEWFKSWEDFENYVHIHNDIIKLFCEDGSHYEVPVGAWIVKTPDGYNIPSRFRFIQKPAKWRFPYGKDETVDKLIAIAECLEMDGDGLWNGYKGTECGKLLRDLARKQVECKPAEWSEEDEKMARFYENDYDNNLGNMPMCEVIENRIKFKDWVLNRLESLRPQPHWKPSEEQIKSIKEAACYSSVFSEKTIYDLISLCNDLQKLM